MPGPASPTLSVGLPVYNGEKFVARAIESILNQDFRDFELIICDNASTDNTSQICQEYAVRDPRVRYYRNETNIGAAPNHNRVFELATAKYFKWAAHDDEDYPEFFSRCLQVLDSAPDSVVLVYPQAELINQDGEVSGQYVVSVASDHPRPHQRLKKLLTSIDLGTPMYGVVRSAALRKTRLHGSFIGADYVMLAELAMLGEIREVPHPLLRKRIHPGRSMEAHRTEREHLAWFDPKALRRKRFLQPSDRRALECLLAVNHIQMNLKDKLACAYVSIVCTQRRSGRIERWRRRVRRVLGMKVT